MADRNPVMREAADLAEEMGKRHARHKTTRLDYTPLRHMKPRDEAQEFARLVKATADTLQHEEVKEWLWYELADIYRGYYFITRSWEEDEE